MKRLLVIGYVWPEPTSSAAGSRMMQLIKFFKNEGFEVVFATTAKKTDNAVNFDFHDIKTESLKLNDPSFDDFLKKFLPDVVLFDRYMMEEQFGWRVDNICPNAIKILDTEDLHFLREARSISYKTGEDVSEIYDNSDLAKREIAAIYRCDLSLIISEFEMDLLIKHFNIPESILCYLPFLLKELSPEDIKNLPSFEERSDLVWIGNFLHEPNWNAVLELKERIWPELSRKLPTVKLKVYGAYSSQKVKNLHNEKERFLIMEWAENADLVMKNSRICVAPINFGAGLKGKLIESMQNGTPSVTTKIGAEGIPGKMKWPGYIVDSSDAFIERTEELYKNNKLWKEKQLQGFNIINERFNKLVHESSFKKKLNEIDSDLEMYRTQNFIGKMMKYHFNRSSYYLSRYIEEKNRNRKPPENK